MTIRQVFLLLVACRGIGEVYGHDPAWGWALIVAATVALVAGRAGFAVLACVGFAAAAVGVPSASMALIGWVAAALALFDGDDLLRVLRVQVIVVYGFAAANKAVSSAFLSGAVLESHASRVAVWPQAMAFAAVAAEAALAFAVWRRWWVALPFAVGMHAMFVIGIATTPMHALSLIAFNGMMVALVWALDVGEVDGVEPGGQRRERRVSGLGLIRLPQRVDEHHKLV